MLRYALGALSALLLVAAGFVLARQVEPESPVPPAPPPVSATAPVPDLPMPPEATPKSKEEKRFARADKNKDGRVLLDELYQPRRKAFAKLDRNRDNRLGFEEWAVTTSTKFAVADRDRSGWLSPAEFETTKPKVKTKRCAC